MSVLIGGREVGPSAPAFVIAEVGVNHNGDLAIAHRLVDAIADAGADAVKFQTFDPDALATADAPKAAYQRANDSAPAAEGQRDMLRRLTLSRDAHVELQRHVAERRLVFLSSPFEEASADFLESLDLPAFKVPSGELTNHPFLRHLARKGRPLILSTGMSELDEVRAAVEVIGGIPHVLLHCTSSYPAPVDACNLRAIDTLRRTFACPVGYSDHTVGAEITLAAIALGASVIEKHVTLDRSMAGPDHAASMEPHDLAQMLAGIRAVESALGDGVKRTQTCERETQAVARKSLFYASALPAGHALTASDLAARRPGTGLSPALAAGLEGRQLAHAVAAGQAVVLGDLRAR